VRHADPDLSCESRGYGLKFDGTAVTLDSFSRFDSVGFS
jgi:hypothetical protein